ncbi:hypothetical protein DFAR_3690033 [Desulfarculales bacterium]
MPPKPYVPTPGVPSRPGQGELREAKTKENKLPKATRLAMLKAADGGSLTKKQQQTLTELETDGFATATA